MNQLKSEARSPKSKGKGQINSPDCVTVEPRKLSLDEWDSRYEQLTRAGLREPSYGGPLRRHVLLEGDLRLRHLRFDNSAAALRLWNFLLTENQRLHAARVRGDKIIGTMKDLGTVPVMAYALPGLRAFYPDGAWWTPCLMECSDGLLQQAEQLGVDASFCPVRAMLAALRRLFSHRAAPGEDGLSHCLVGDAPPPVAGPRRSRLRPARQFERAAGSSRLRAGGAGTHRRGIVRPRGASAR
jgi:hypothetical protein